MASQQIVKKGRHYCDIAKMTNLVQSLYDADKKRVSDMGFGSFITMKPYKSKLQNKLTWWLVSKVDPKDGILDFGDGKIRIASLVEELLGVPNGVSEVILGNPIDTGLYQLYSDRQLRGKLIFYTRMHKIELTESNTPLIQSVEEHKLEALQPLNEVIYGEEELSESMNVEEENVDNVDQAVRKMLQDSIEEIEVPRVRQFKEAFHSKVPRLAQEIKAYILAHCVHRDGYKEVPAGHLLLLRLMQTLKSDSPLTLLLNLLPWMSIILGLNKLLVDSSLLRTWTGNMRGKCR